LVTPQELEAAMLKPGAVFRSPEKVIENTQLSRDQKIEILLRWD
jgi:hypothetical protein